MGQLYRQNVYWGLLGWLRSKAVNTGQLLMETIMTRNA